MAFNGITVAALRHEIADKITGGRIAKIAQTESDEIILTIKPMMERGGGQVKLLLSADATLPLCYFTEESKPSPKTAPAFCMLLRKHLTGGRILSVTQPDSSVLTKASVNALPAEERASLPADVLESAAEDPFAPFRTPGLERILRFEIEHLNEMGDTTVHSLILELMGKYSNLIFVDDKGMIVDSIKRISGMVSSVREVLPGRPYYIAQTQNKRNAYTEMKGVFLTALSETKLSPAQFLVRRYTGFSNVTSEELCERAVPGEGLSARSGEALSALEKEQLWDAFHDLTEKLSAGDFSPSLYLQKDAKTARGGVPKEYSAFSLLLYEHDPAFAAQRFDTVSALLSYYYAEKNRITRIRQRTADLRHTVTTILARDVHKLDQQNRQMADTEKRDKYRVYGELLNAYGYSIPDGAKSAKLDNYYTGEKLTVPLDPTLTASANAARYFARYNKLKRTAEAVSAQITETEAEISELKSILVSLDLSAEESDLAEIREELAAQGLIQSVGPRSGNGTSVRNQGSGSGRGGNSSRSGKGAKNGRGAGGRVPEGKPLHYVSSDGFDIYVGKNNLQNDRLTFHEASGGDLWFHANDMPGSHVILRTHGAKLEEIPDKTFEEAAALAAYYSSGREMDKVEIDYLYRRDVKKPSGARPGFVVYYTNWSMMAVPEIHGIQEAK